MWWSSNPNLNVVRFRLCFCKSEIRRIFRLIQIQIQLSFWKARVHRWSQSAVTISHRKVNKYTLNSYLLMSVQTEHRIGLGLLVRYLGWKMPFFVPGDLDLWPWPSNSSKWGTKHVFRSSVWMWRKPIQRFRRYFIHKKPQTDGAKNRTLHVHCMR